MAGARLYCIFVLLLYSQLIYGQQALGNNQNIAVSNNAIGLQQQQSMQRTGNNANQIASGGININCVQQPNLQQANLQPSPSVSGTKQGNLQQPSYLPPNLQSQTAPQNNFQITKIGFTPVSQGMVNNPVSTQQLQNAGINSNVQVTQPQNNQISNAQVGIANAPISVQTLADLAALKGQPSLLSILNPQNNGQQNQQIVSNTNPACNQLTDAQKQYLVRTLQSQNQQGINVVQPQPRVVNVDNQQGISVHTIQGMPQQGQAIVTSLGNQPPYITVQAQPLTTYMQSQTPQIIVEEEPSILSLILSELGPQYGITTALPPQQRGSKTSLKTLIPIIINMLKERNSCGCRNCGCPNACQNSSCSNLTPEDQIAQIFGGYSNQKTYGQDTDDSSTRVKTNDDEVSKNNDKDKNDYKKKPIDVESEENSEEDDSEYVDDGDE